MEDSLKKKIAAYITLACAVLMKQNAEAQIVYHDILPDDSLNNFNVMEYQFLDLNNDGVTDIKFTANRNPTGFDNIYAQAKPGDQFLVYPLSFNVPIGSATSSSNYFDNGYDLVQFYSSFNWEFGPWLNTTDKYLGVKVHEGANDFYGWIRLDVNVPSSKITVKDFALNTSPNTPILAGDIGCISVNPEMPIITQASADTLVSTPASSYQWYFNGTALTGETNQNLAFNINGDYSLITTDTNNCHLLSNVFHYGNCNVNTPIISITSSDTICAGLYSQFTVSGITADNYYSWMANGEIINQNPGWGTFGFILDSSAEVNVAIVNGLYGCADTSNSIHVEVINQIFSGSLTGYPTNIGCNNDSSLLITDLTFNYASYHWYRENNTIQVSTSNIFNATTTGFYHVDVVEPGTGCHYSTNQFGVSPAAPPVPEIWQSIDTLYTGLYFKYQWYLNGSILTNDTLRKLVITQQGNYSVEVWNEADCSTITPIQNFAACSSLQTQISTSSNNFYCENNALIDLSSSTIPQGFLLQWFKNGIAVLSPTTDSTNSFFLTNDAAFSAQLYNTSSGCIDTSNTISFSVGNGANINILSPSPTFYCSDSAVIELNTSSIPNGFLLQWYQNSSPVLSPTTDSTASFLITNNSAFYGLLYNQANGCSDTSNIISYVINNTVSIDVFSDSPTSFCGDSAEIDLNTSYIPPGYQVQWFINNIPVLTPTTDTVFTTEIFSASDVNAYLFSTNSDCSDTSNTINFSLHQNPSPTISQSNDTLFTGSFSSYQWYYYGGILPADTLQYLPVSLEGNYKVTVWNQYDCSAQSIFYYYTPTNISVIGNQNDLQLLMHENFAELKFMNEKWMGAEVKLINNAGQLLSELTVKKSSEQFDISQLPKGIYFISISNSKEILNYKISIL
ncbi:hypothetical protein LBMAG27_09680 [Bacteroidota bacterium]|nr:hypothetical protein LBMAG27_09680 [Bacteroidota bacterium]